MRVYSPVSKLHFFFQNSSTRVFSEKQPLALTYASAARCANVSSTCVDTLFAEYTASRLLTVNSAPKAALVTTCFHNQDSTSMNASDAFAEALQAFLFHNKSIYMHPN